MSTRPRFKKIFNIDSPYFYSLPLPASFFSIFSSFFLPSFFSSSHSFLFPLFLRHTALPDIPFKYLHRQDLSSFPLFYVSAVFGSSVSLEALSLLIFVPCDVLCLFSQAFGKCQDTDRQEGFYYRFSFQGLCFFFPKVGNFVPGWFNNSHNVNCCATICITGLMWVRISQHYFSLFRSNIQLIGNKYLKNNSNMFIWLVGLQYLWIYLLPIFFGPNLRISQNYFRIYI